MLCARETTDSLVLVTRAFLPGFEPDGGPFGDPKDPPIEPGGKSRSKSEIERETERERDGVGDDTFACDRMRWRGEMQAKDGGGHAHEMVQHDDGA